MLAYIRKNTYLCSIFNSHTSMNSTKQLIINALIGGGASVKIFDYCHLADDVCVRYAGQLPQAEQQLRILRDSGRLSLGGSNNTLLDPNVKAILQGARSEAIDTLKSALEQLEYLDTLLVACDCRPTIVSASLDDVINAVVDSGLIEKSSDWAAVVMLCQEQGKNVTETKLINALRINRKAMSQKLPLKQTLQRAFVPYGRKNHFPAWPKLTAKENRFYAIASVAFPLISVLND